MNLLKISLCSLLLFLSSGVFSQQHRYIQNHKEIAEELSEEYGIPSSVILAVAFVETGGGTSKNSKKLNNHFGIVGKNHSYKSKYRYFDSVRDSYEGFCKVLSRKKYYNKLKGSDNFSEWIKAIASAGYSTQPKEWKRRLKLIYNKFDLSSL